MLEPIPCTAKQLAAVLGISERRISELTRVETFVKPYELVRCVQAYVAFLRSTPGNLTDERARLTRALASMAELKLRQKSGDLVDRTAVDGQFFKLARTVRDNFQNLPPRTAGLVAAERNQQKYHDILAEEVRQILEGLTRGSGNGAEVRPAPPPRKKEPPPPPRRAA